VAVYDARFAKPVDVGLLRELIATGKPVFTVEDHHHIGGFGACVIETCVKERLSTDNLHILGLPDEWIYQGSRAEQLAQAGIDADGIVRAIHRVLKQPVATDEPARADSPSLRAIR
jgi:1-deoxy-D-xylulose-5-phosphate synthase